VQASRPAPERARLFVALELPATVREALHGWSSGWAGAARGLRLVRAEDLHVTLCFLGSQEEGQIGPVLSACQAVAGRPAASLRVGEAIWLPPRRPRVLAVGLEDPGGELAAAQATLSEALAAGGWYVPERRSFLVHVTVARVGRGAALPSELPPLPSVGTFPGTRVVLYRSRLGRGGARYEPLGAVALR
jgi:2'-5' RNA ligase